MQHSFKFGRAVDVPATISGNVKSLPCTAQHSHSADPGHSTSQHRTHPAAHLDCADELHLRMLLILCLQNPGRQTPWGVSCPIRGRISKTRSLNWITYQKNKRQAFMHIPMITPLFVCDRVWASRGRGGASCLSPPPPAPPPPPNRGQLYRCGILFCLIFALPEQCNSTMKSLNVLLCQYVLSTAQTYTWLPLFVRKKIAIATPMDQASTAMAGTMFCTVACCPKHYRCMVPGH